MNPTFKSFIPEEIRNEIKETKHQQFIKEILEFGEFVSPTPINNHSFNTQFGKLDLFPKSETP